MKRCYIKPLIEIYAYSPEAGVKVSVGTYTDDVRKEDYVLIQGGDRSIMRSTDEYTEYTNSDGEFEIGLWE